jgi:hypothetical protein
MVPVSSWKLPVISVATDYFMHHHQKVVKQVFQEQIMHASTTHPTTWSRRSHTSLIKSN